MRVGSIILSTFLAAVPFLARGAAPASVAVNPSTAELAARRALAGARLALGAGDGLRVEATFRTADGGQIVRMRQLHGGFPVLGAVVVVRLDAAGAPLRIVDGSRALGPVASQATVSLDEALLLARAALSGVALPVAPSGEAALVVAPGAGGRLAWVVDVDAMVRTVAPTVVLDALTGEVLSVVDRARYTAAHGQANVFHDGPAAKNARQADGSFDTTGTDRVVLNALSSTDPGSHLTGADLVVTNCCPTEGCDPAKGAKKADAQLSFDVPPNPFVPNGKLDITVHTVLCDEQPVATADADGNFLYQPAKEPVSDQDPVPGPSEGDAFSEVMAYHYAQSELDFVRSLDPEFRMGPDARPLHVTANFLIPDLQDAQNADLTQVLATRSITISHLARFPNAAFVPRGQASRIGAIIPGFGHDYDSLIIAQGPTADFGYDPDVVSHEFGHGVVEVSAGLADYSADDWGVLDAPGAMNEGFADLLAAMRENDPHIGEYVGAFLQQGEGALRDLTNGFACPSVLTGEVHQDSQHFSAAVWAARTMVAGSSESDRRKFDQAVLAALRTLKPDSSFDEAGNALAAEVETLFDAAAKATVTDALAARKVVGCERVMDLTPELPRAGYQLAPTSKERGWLPYAPGPMQFRLQVPPGTTAIRLALKGAGAGIGGLGLPGGAGGGGGTPVQAQLRADERIHFTYGAAAVSSDATKTVAFQGPRGQDPVAQFVVDASCVEKSWFVALANTGDAPFSVESLAVSYTTDAAKVAACHPGLPVGSTAGSGGDVTAGSCNCGSGGSALTLPALAGLLALLRRRKARA